MQLEEREVVRLRDMLMWSRKAIFILGQRSFDEIKYHTIMGVANGLTRAEIEEVFLSTIPYCGFPAANTAKAAISEGFKLLEEAGKI